ncbi:MAG: hypothetical protein A2161_16510 [Candidatus Schekmanbacteria bacterium RBG_13_48_7]|uniref:Type II secretion system protein GspF domain-containing protein n=1 Tax=Candidatus Schekmanbacteria bacterium RBG_13_48_7 TaxID=1817878 RepID=A0A1F7RWF8_9BACT|nr:MAG: hypothetical protein A2161_16510 [Candidatus Schekmanbacteria bacterium RBG_13_48_7]
MNNINLNALKNRLIFTDLLESLLKSGMQLPQAVEYIGQRVSGKVKDLCNSIAEKLKRGLSIVESFSGYPDVLPDYFVRILASSEETGTFQEALEALKKSENREFAFQKRLRSISLYPRVLFFLSLGLFYFFFFFVLPKFEELYVASFGWHPGLHSRLLDLYRGIVHTSAYLANYRIEILFIFLIILFIFMIGFRLRAFKRLSNWLRYNIPFIGILRKHGEYITFFDTLGLLLERGTPLDQAWENALKTIHNRSIHQDLAFIFAPLKRGESLADLTGNIRWPTKYIPSALKLAANRGNLHETCYELVSYLEKNTMQKIQVYIVFLPFIFFIFPIFIILFMLSHSWIFINSILY